MYMVSLCTLDLQLLHEYYLNLFLLFSRGYMMCSLLFSFCSDWESLCIYDSRYGIELFNYDLLHPTSFNDYDDDDDSNG